MVSYEKKGFTAAVVVHLTALIALVIHTFWSAQRPEPPRHVFELVPVIESLPVAERTEVPQQEERFEVPEIAPMRPLETPRLADPKPEPAPTPPPPPVPAPAPAPRPPVEPPPRELINIRDRVPNQPAERAQPAPRPRVNAPVLNTADLEKNLNALLTSPRDRQRAANLSTVERDALVQYGQRLNFLINQAWSGSPSMDRGLVAVVEFDVAPGGRISNIRFRPASGNSTFDTSVRAAVERVGSGGPTPTGESHTFTMTFRMVDLR